MGLINPIKTENKNNNLKTSFLIVSLRETPLFVIYITLQHLFPLI